MSYNSKQVGIQSPFVKASSKSDRKSLHHANYTQNPVQLVVFQIETQRYDLNVLRKYMTVLDTLSYIFKYQVWGGAHDFENSTISMSYNSKQVGIQSRFVKARNTEIRPQCIEKTYGCLRYPFIHFHITSVRRCPRLWKLYNIDVIKFKASQNPKSFCQS